MYNFRIDLAVERTNIYIKANKLEEIDDLIENMKDVVARGINMSL